MTEDQTVYANGQLMMLSELTDRIAELEAENERLREAVDAEQGRWQQEICELLVGLSGDVHLDGSGCDSGDPLDVTLAEIRIAFNHATETSTGHGQ